MRRTLRKIALIYDARLAYDLKVMRGVADFLQRTRGYSVYIEESALKDQRLPDLRTWKGDGIIADMDDPRVARIVTQSGLPTVGFGGGRQWGGTTVPYFYTNNVAISGLVLRHFIDRGFHHFAYCGYPPSPINEWSLERQEAFSDAVIQHGSACSVFHGRQHDAGQWASLEKALGVWLRSLPRPVAIMAANDQRGRQVLEVCRSSGIHVPDEVAVVGVDNDELLCALSSPPLSSVEQGARQLGTAAAELLDRIITGDAVAARRIVVDPIGIVTRPSSDVLAIKDDRVAAAMAFIREHACDHIKVPDIVRAAAISRSSLENRFMASLGYTIRTAVSRTQLERARRLIAETDLPLKQVAIEAGFRSVQHMTTRFARRFGKTPAKYRRHAYASS